MKFNTFKGKKTRYEKLCKENLIGQVQWIIHQAHSDVVISQEKAAEFIKTNLPSFLFFFL